MKNLLILIFVTGMASWHLHAQPCFSPTITSPRLGYFNSAPNSILFCDNNDTEILSTQTYDTYQWYKQEWAAVPPGVPNPNPWIAITGANSQTYTINGTDDLLYYFKVEATLDSCTEESPAILADGYNFGLPYLIATFQPGTYQFIGNGTYNVCNGASVLLENGFDQVYGLHTWYKCIPSDLPPFQGDPCIIPNENGDTYTATTTGFYGFWACTSYCPDICLFLGLPAFIQLNFGDWSFCSLGNPEFSSNHVKLYPNPTTQVLFVGNQSDNQKTLLKIMDMSGKVVFSMSDYHYGEPIDLSKLEAGSYLLVSETEEGKIFRNKFVKK
ncbi:secretion protein [Flavobacterium cyanobacteriorum]|uniref:Secretion protein n=2 Tax=Flavobacterium cyanobacteriorum TaxID=2022802 RepID=A0A255ZXC1_9FLAO|nr:secretion protein [Flavobacterium cyanobacteriorum]